MAPNWPIGCLLFCWFLSVSSFLKPLKCLLDNAAGLKSSKFAKAKLAYIRYDTIEES